MNKLTPSPLLLAVLSLVLVVAAACAPVSRPRTGSRTIGARHPTRSRTSSGSGRASRTEPPAKRLTVANPQAYTIIFRDDGTVTGQADCNTFSGTYTQDGGFFITVTPDVMAACGGDSLDQQYLVLLEEIVAGGPDGAGGLALETAGGEQRMTFVNGGRGADCRKRLSSNHLHRLEWQTLNVAGPSPSPDRTSHLMEGPHRLTATSAYSQPSSRSVTLCMAAWQAGQLFFCWMSAVRILQLMLHADRMLSATTACDMQL